MAISKNSSKKTNKKITFKSKFLGFLNKSKQRPLLAILAGILILGSVLIGGFFLYNNISSNQSTAQAGFTCPPGTTKTSSACIYTAQATCPSGGSPSGSVCVTNAIATPWCQDGTFSLSGSQCVKAATLQQGQPTYSCPNGGVLPSPLSTSTPNCEIRVDCPRNASGTLCSSSLSTQCPSGFSPLRNDSFTFQTICSQLARSTPGTNVYTCPLGGSLQGTQCVTGTQTKYVCQSGTLSGTQCQSQITYVCNQGGSLSFNTCTVQPTGCDNGTINPPSCNSCPSGQIFTNNSCQQPCFNGATNPPSCNQCPTGKTLVNNQCVSPCTNGTIDPPSCLQCPAGRVYVNGSCVQSCSNGAINPPNCNQCSGGLIYSLGQCAAPCTNGATNPPACNQCPAGQIYYGNSCTYPCSNGASNPPTCNACPSGQVYANGQCVNNCTNRATNPPACDQCPAGLIFSSGQCVTPCTNGANNPPSCNQCPVGLSFQNNQCVAPCVNGAINPPSCNQCPAGQTLVNNVCVNNCTNGANNPPNCNQCPSGQIFQNNQCINNCTNGAINPPACNQCPGSQILVNNVCVNACTNGANNPPACNTFPNCTNGASNPPACNYCPANQYFNGVSCISCPVGTTSNPGSNAIIQCVPTTCTNGASNPPLCNQCPGGITVNSATQQCPTIIDPTMIGNCDKSGTNLNIGDPLTCKFPITVGTPPFSLPNGTVASIETATGVSSPCTLDTVNNQIICTNIPSVNGRPGSENIYLAIGGVNLNDKGDINLVPPDGLLIPLDQITFSPSKVDRKQFKASDLTIGVVDARIVEGATCDIYSSLFPTKSSPNTNYSKLATVSFSGGKAQTSLPASSQEKPKWRFKISCTNPASATNGYANKNFGAFPDYIFKYGAISLVEVSGVAL